MVASYRMHRQMHKGLSGTPQHITPSFHLKLQRQASTRQRLFRVCAGFREEELVHALRTKRTISVNDLKDPAHIGGSTDSSVQVKDHGGQLSLDAYMRLPVEQYYELQPEMIKPLGGNQFALAVPRVNIFSVWVEPLCQIEVTSSENPDVVTLKALKCRLAGSETIESFKLDERFSLSFVATLTWTPGWPTTSPDPASSPGGMGLPPAGPQGGAGTSGHQSSAWGPGGTNGSQAPSSQALQPAAQQQGGISLPWPFSGSQQQPAAQQSLPTGTIHGTAKLDVWSEVVAPFHLMPRGVLEGSGSAVMAGLVRSLLPPFLQRLGTDYERWATDPEYRRKRATREMAQPAVPTQW